MVPKNVSQEALCFILVKNKNFIKVTWKVLLFMVLLFFSIPHKAIAQCSFPASIGIVQTPLINGMQVDFSATLNGGTAPYTYHWDFGDGTTSSMSSISHNYFVINCDTTIFTATLLVTDDVGCLGTDTIDILVLPLHPPALIDLDSVSAFSNCEYNPTSQNPNFVLDVDLGTPDSAYYTGYTINWGDFSPLQSVTNASFPLTHTYTQLGYFYITVTGYDVSGCTHTWTQIAYNQSNPAIGLNSLGSTVGCAPQEFSFVLSQYQYNSPGTIYTWDFGDSTGQVVWNYSQPFINDTITHVYTYTSCDEPGNSFNLTVTAENNCDQSSASISNIKIYQPGLPVPSFDSVVCVGDSVPFYNMSIPGYTWNCYLNGQVTWDFGDSTTSMAQTPVHVYDSAGIYNVILSMAGSICPVDADTTPIIVLDKPSILADAFPQTGCAPLTVQFTDTSSHDHLWTVTPATGWYFDAGTSANDKNPVITFDTSGTYLVELFVSNQCGVVDTSFTIVVGDVLQASIASISDTCGTKVFTPQAMVNNMGSPIMSYEWQFPGGVPATSTLANPGTVTYSNPGFHLVTLVVTNDCGTDTATQSFYLHPFPSLTISTNAVNVCPGQQVTLQAAGAVYYQWLQGVPNPTSPTVTVTPVTTTTYYVIGSVPGGCSVMDSITIHVQPGPIVNISAPSTTICKGDTVMLTATGALNYSWTPMQGLISANNNEAIVAPIQNSVYEVIGSDTSGCIDTTTITILVNDPVINVSGSPSVICAGDQAVLSATGLSTYSWAPSTGLSATTGSTVTASPGVTTTYTVLGFDSIGCFSDTTVVVTVNPSPSVFVSGPASTICSGSQIALAASGAQSYAWSPAASLNTTTGASVTASPVTTTTYYVTGTDSNGCVDSDSITITVYPEPQISINAVPQNICPGGQSQITVSGALSYVWTPSVTLNATTGNTVVASPATTTQYTVTATDAYGCTKDTSITVYVHPVNLTVQPAIASICYGDSLQLSVSGASTYLWNPSSTISSTTSSTPVVTPLNTTVYSVQGTNSYGCIDTATVTVQVNPLPGIGVTPSISTICYGTNTTLTASGASTYSWSPAATLSSASGAVTTASPTITTTYTVVGQDTNGCFGTNTTIVEVLPNPIVNITPSFATICEGDSIGVTVSGNYSFVFGGGPLIQNGNTALLFPSVTTSYTVVGTDSFGCTGNDTVEVIVDSVPLISYIHDSIVCNASPVLFNNSTIGAAACYWDFGDGSTITMGNSPTHTYIQAGVYAVTLYAVNASGCSDSASSIITVVDPPTAQLTILPDTGCGPLTVMPSATITGVGSTYLWDFGNGNFSNQLNPGAQVFNSPVVANDTTYNITFAISNVCGTSNFTHPVMVANAPTANFGINPTSGCSPLPVSIGNISSGNSTSYFWDFGDGNTSTLVQPMQHVYTTNIDTTFTITMVVENHCGSDTAYQSVLVHPNSLNAVAMATPVSGCSPLTVTFHNYSNSSAGIYWDFGDGNFSNAVNPIHTYHNSGTYQAMMLIDDGCSADTSWINITVAQGPSLSIAAVNDTVCLGEAIHFNNMSSPLSGLSWDFGDGNSSNNSNPIHQYTSPGVYHVVMTGTALGTACVDSISMPVVVHPTPESSFFPSDTIGCSPFTVTFNNTSLNANYNVWDFNDGTISVSPSPSHTFVNQGNYNVKLVTTNVWGCKDSATFIVTALPSPVSQFTSNNPPVSCGYPVSVDIVNLSQGSTSYYWDLGNGQTSTMVNPNVVYDTSGTYPIVLIAYNQYGCSDTSTAVNYQVYEAPKADFNLGPFEGCTPFDITFINTSVNATQYTWDFGNGQTSTVQNPSHTYSVPGKYSVKLIATLNSFCADTLNVPDVVLVNPSPVPDFAFVYMNTPLNSGKVEFENLTIDTVAHQFVWDMGDGSYYYDVSPVHYYQHNGSYNVSLVAINQFGCSAEISKMLKIDYVKGLFMPNAIAPDNPSESVRRFEPKGVGLESFYIAVYDQWGNKIWESDKVVDGMPADYWDGTINGDPAPQDVYVWKAEAIFIDGTIWQGVSNGGEKSRRYGTITIIR